MKTVFLTTNTHRMVELASRLTDLHAAQQRHADLVSVKKTLELNLDAYIRLAYFEVQRCSTAFAAQRHRPRRLPAVRRRGGGRPRRRARAVRAASERVRKGVEQLAAGRLPDVAPSPRPPPTATRTIDRKCPTGTQLRMAQCSTTDVRPKSARRRQRHRRRQRRSCGGGGRGGGRSVDGLIQVDQSSPRVVRHRPAPPPTWSAAEPGSSPSRWWLRPSGCVRWRAAASGASSRSGRCRRASRRRWSRVGCLRTAAASAATAPGRRPRSTLRAALGGCWSKPPSSALEGRLRGLLLLLSAPLAPRDARRARGGGRGVAAAVAAAGALVSALTCSPGQRLLSVVAPAPPHPAGGADCGGRLPAGGAVPSGRASRATPRRAAGRASRRRAARDALQGGSRRRGGGGSRAAQRADARPAPPRNGRVAAAAEGRERPRRRRPRPARRGEPAATRAAALVLAEQRARRARAAARARGAAAPPRDGAARRRRAPMATGLLPLLAGLPGVASVQSWRSRRPGRAASCASSPSASPARRPSRSRRSRRRRRSARRATPPSSPTRSGAPCWRRCRASSTPTARGAAHRLAASLHALPPRRRTPPSDHVATAAEGARPTSARPSPRLCRARRAARRGSARRDDRRCAPARLARRVPTGWRSVRSGAAAARAALRFNELLQLWPPNAPSGAPARRRAVATRECPRAGLRVRERVMREVQPPPVI